MGLVWFLPYARSAPKGNAVRVYPDPFATLSRETFVALEMSQEERFLDRLERMWAEGSLSS